MRKSLTDKITEEIIADFLKSKQIGVGERLPTVRELQKKYSVSVSTISHALEMLAQRGMIDRRPNGASYVVDSNFSTEQAGRLKLIGYVMASAEHPTGLTSYAYKGVEKVANKEGYHLLTANSDGDYDAERAHVARFVAAGCEAIVIFPVIRTGEQLAHDYLKTEFKDTPIVLIDMAYPEQKRSQVVFDNYLAGYEMAASLIEKGHRKIAFMDLCTGHMHRSNSDRFRGYTDALLAAGITPRPEDRWKITGLSWARGLAMHLSRWRNDQDRATALIALEDNAAMMAISIVRDMGFSVPEDLQVTGFDNWRTAECFSPMFPTTMPDFERAGEVATYTALQHVRGQLAEPINYVLPVPILWRKTPTFDADFVSEVEQSAY